MLFTILISLLVVILIHVTYTYIQSSFSLVKTKNVNAFQNEKVDELIKMLETKVDFTSMEQELANLLDNEIDIKTTGYEI